MKEGRHQEAMSVPRIMAVYSAGKVLHETSAHPPHSRRDLSIPSPRSLVVELDLRSLPLHAYLNLDFQFNVLFSKSLFSFASCS